MQKIYELLRSWVKEEEQPKAAPEIAKDKEADTNGNMRRLRK
ncbi:MAG: hypothetical protein OIN66_14685 [Candidatus Methanoperedens sp.]|nr:hypothetical protein [Candidatus Methanoperedens sp.]